jgi:type IV pilus assembly protein PilW
MLIRESHGVTLVELMFGMVIAMIVVGAGYTVMTGSQKATTVNDQATQMQQNVRLAMDLLTQDFKMAGFGMTAAVGGCSFAVVPGDNTPGGADSGPDSVSLVVPTTSTVNPLWTLSTQVTGAPTATSLTLQAGAGASMTASGFAAAPFALPQPISIGGTVSATVTALAGDVLTVSSPVNSPAVFPVGTAIHWLQCITYDIVRATDANAATLCSGNPPCLRRGGVAIAEGIEDLQLAYACDGCAGAVPDGLVDDQNASNTFDTADFISNSTWTSAPLTPDTIRMVRVNIVARQLRADPDWRNTQPVAVEDHNPTSDAGYDQQTYQQLRRRVLTRTIQLRNFGL